jgi:hypothetical protein
MGGSLTICEFRGQIGIGLFHKVHKHKHQCVKFSMKLLLFLQKTILLWHADVLANVEVLLMSEFWMCIPSH